MSTFDLQIGKMPEFVRVKLMQVDFGAQSPARDPYCAVSIKEAVADAGKFFFHISHPKSACCTLNNLCNVTLHYCRLYSIYICICIPLCISLHESSVWNGKKV